MHKNDTLWLCEPLQETLWLRVLGEEHPFDSKGHFPVLAGYDTSGRELYIARSWDGESAYYTYVSDGDMCISFIRDDGKWTTASRFFVLVLKHDPCDVGVPEIPEGAKFQTGPVYWVQADDDDESETDIEVSSNSAAEQRVVEVDLDDSCSNSVEAPWRFTTFGCVKEA